MQEGVCINYVRNYPFRTRRGGATWCCKLAAYLLLLSVVAVHCGLLACGLPGTTGCCPTNISIASSGKCSPSSPTLSIPVFKTPAGKVSRSSFMRVVSNERAARTAEGGAPCGVNKCIPGLTPLLPGIVIGMNLGKWRNSSSIHPACDNCTRISCAVKDTSSVIGGTGLTWPPKRMGVPPVGHSSDILKRCPGNLPATVFKRSGLSSARSRLALGPSQSTCFSKVSRAVISRSARVFARAISACAPTRRALSKSVTLSFARESKYSANTSPAKPSIAKIIPAFLALGTHTFVLKRTRGNPLYGSRRKVVGQWSATSSMSTPAMSTMVDATNRCRYRLASATKARRVNSSSAVTSDAREGGNGGNSSMAVERDDRIMGTLAVICFSVLASLLILALFRRR
jgi:hypothetical protein